MPSSTLDQIYGLNPATIINNTDLFYLVQSPYTAGTDAAITGSSLKSLFLQPSNNLSDLSNVATARTNLGLTGIASATPPLSAALGGTGVSNGVNTAIFNGNLSFAGPFNTVGAFSSTFTYTGLTNLTMPTSGTLATTSQLPVLPLSLTNGGSNAALVANNGGIVWSNASQFQILSGTATANQVLLSGASSAPSWSTTTFPSTISANQLLYASAANTISGLSSGNNGILLTSSAGVPSISTTLGQGLQIASSQLLVGGANNIPFNSGKGIQDANGNSSLLFTTTASAVNYFTLTNSATGAPPQFYSAGSDTNVGMKFSSQGLGTIIFDHNSGGAVVAVLAPTSASAVNYLSLQNSVTGAALTINSNGTDPNINVQLNSKGTGGAQVKGCTDASNAPAGYVGEYISSNIVSGSAVALVNSTAKTITSINLTAGDWEVWGEFGLSPASSTTVTIMQGAISPTANTIPITPADGQSMSEVITNSSNPWVSASTGIPYLGIVPCRVNVTATTTYYLIGLSYFGTSTNAGYGKIAARRIR